MQDRQRESRRRATASLGQTQNIPAGEDFRNAARGCIALHITPEIFESVKSVGFSRRCGWIDFDVVLDLVLGVSMDAIVELVGPDCIVSGQITPVGLFGLKIWPLDVNLKFLELVRRELKLVREVRCILYHRKPADGMLMDRSSCSSVGHGPASSKYSDRLFTFEFVLLLYADSKVESHADYFNVTVHLTLILLDESSSSPTYLS
ncbi:hypothetical protein FNV43_RR21576 [Rhamnella rubrinervis]|uniref:Uncharacterized protein n=1 Tax=Rhamnella rubrinervis TaxID=2594499 RepID=A0A8K0E1X8_9ROSA|nr:hypothetical protein FNV43_RR21576 [Rhamnella rubrinervis]